MHTATQSAPATVYMLADHLDGALAAGEDLLKISLNWHAPLARAPEDSAFNSGDERVALDALKTREMMLVAHVLRSREQAEELAKSDIHMRPIAKLYNAGTVLLADVVKELGDKAQDFDTGDGMVAYLRARGMIADDAAAPAPAVPLPVNEQFLIAARIPLGAVLDLAAMFLDVLETNYDLYDDTDRAGLLMHEMAQPAVEAVL